MENKDQTQEKKKKKITRIILAILLLLIAFLLILIATRSPDLANDRNLRPMEDGLLDGEQGQNKRDPMIDEGIVIPGYSGLFVSEDKPYVYLNNPEENTVYFQYKITDEQGTVLYENSDSELIPPGKSAKADMYSMLPKGKHKIIISVNTYDTVTTEQCNGASQESVISVE